jgi:glycosyltransferase involved in cell wall biosynthesis
MSACCARPMANGSCGAGQGEVAATDRETSPVRQVDRDKLRAPALIVDVELTGVDPDKKLSSGRYNSIWCLARRGGVPESITFWDVAGEGDATLEEMISAMGSARLDADVSNGGDQRPSKPSTAEMTVVICTRDRPTELRRALSSLRAQSDTDFEILVVDNAPSLPAAAVVAEFGSGRCRYVIEPQRGLCRARNRALREARTELVAWIDDDEIADVDWVRRLKEGFGHECKPVAVCGVMLPAELETEAQVLFEQYGGFNKGRGIAAEVLLAGSPTVWSPLYPSPGFGAGGNMAFQAEALRRVGGFDQYLGAGTRTHGGDEGQVLASLLRSGEAVLHWPSAITWHFHRREMSELRQQLYGYSAGLSAFYVSMIRSDPAAVLFEMARVVPHAVGDLLRPDQSVRVGQLPSDFPRYLLRASRRGFLDGAFLYLYEVAGTRRAAGRNRRVRG